MICVICNGPIEVEKGSGWANGYNAAPVAEGRCCKKCDDTVVYQARLAGSTGIDPRKAIKSMKDMPPEGWKKIHKYIEDSKKLVKHSIGNSMARNLYHKNGTPLAVEYTKIPNTQCDIRYCGNPAVWQSCKADNGNCHPAEIKNGFVAHHHGGVHLWDFPTAHDHEEQGHRDDDDEKWHRFYRGLTRTGTYKLCLSHARTMNLDSVRNYITPLLSPPLMFLDPKKSKEQGHARINMANSALINLRYMLMTDELFSRYIQHNVGQLSHNGSHPSEELKTHQQDLVDTMTQEFGGNWSFNSTNTQAWQAQGERLLAMVSVLDAGIPVSASGVAVENPVSNAESYTDPETGEIVTASIHLWGLQTALDLSNASVYLWSKETFAIAESMPLPKHQVSLPLLQYPNMFFSFETAYTLTMPHAANQEFVDAAADLAKDLNIEVDLNGKATTDIGEKNWMYLREIELENGEPAVEIIHDMTANQDSYVIRDIITHGATYPDDFENPEYVRISLAMLNFLNTPLLYSEKRKLERTIRRELERKTGAKGQWDDPTYESNLIILRRPQRRVSYNDEDEGPMHHDFQWWTSGHFRNQYYPSLGDVDDPHSHKLIWIDHFLKGPKDKPIRTKPTNLVVQ